MTLQKHRLRLLFRSNSWRLTRYGTRDQSLPTSRQDDTRITVTWSYLSRCPGYSRYVHWHTDNQHCVHTSVCHTISQHRRNADALSHSRSYHSITAVAYRNCRVATQMTCRQYLSDRPQLANQHAQLWHHLSNRHFCAIVQNRFLSVNSRSKKGVRLIVNKWKR